jgi:chromosome segregation ATPase
MSGVEIKKVKIKKDAATSEQEIDCLAEDMKLLVQRMNFLRERVTQLAERVTQISEVKKQLRDKELFLWRCWVRLSIAMTDQQTNGEFHCSLFRQVCVCVHV